MVTMCCQMCERTSERAQPKWLANDIRVQRDAKHQRLRSFDFQKGDLEK